MTRTALATLLPLVLAQAAPEGEFILSEAVRFEEGFKEVAPEAPVFEWLIPFATGDRKSLAAINSISVFGAPRQSYLKGHIHSGLDLRPRKRRPDGNRVLSMARGIVCSVHLGEPHLTVVVKHLLPNGEYLFTSYKHLAEAWVEPGRLVDASTELGRLYTSRESKKFGGDYHHLHLEVRKLFDDRGTASWLTLTREELEKRFLDPLAFLKRQLSVPKPLPAAMAEKFIAAARELLGVGYQFGGRLEQGGGIDCLGLVFYAAERIGRCGWRSFSVNPTEIAKSAVLGRPVPGLDPVAARFFDPERLFPGDVLFLVAEAENSAEPAIGSIDGRPVWVWHIGIYTGGGNWINADYLTGKVGEGNLRQYLADNGYAGVFVTRMADGPKPKTCRQHACMELQRSARPSGERGEP